MAWQTLGWKAAWFSEIEPFPCAVLAHRYPDVPNLGDMTKIYENETFRKETIDILVGGTPCQPFSVAGLREGLDDPRGNLLLKFCQIAQEKCPEWVVWENVPGVLSSDGGRAFGSILGALDDCGYGVAWRVLDARYFRVPQTRRRVFVVGHLGEGRAASEVLFDTEGREEDAGACDPVCREGASDEDARRLPPRPEDTGWVLDSPVGTEAAYTLQASNGNRYSVTNKETLLYDTFGMGVVRRLTPREWERLQGFPDDYTLVPYRGKLEELCPDSPRYKALGASIAVPVLRWIGERIAAIEGLPRTEVVRLPDPETVAKGLSDSELVEKCVQGFCDLREAIPYLREARDRFAQPGRRVPVPGNPTWTEWVQTNLHVTVRRVQQLLSAGAEPRETDFARSKIKQQARKLRSGDWRGLMKATERRTAQVFGSVEDPERLAGAIRDFAQGIADRHAQPGKKLVVSVSVRVGK